MNEFDVKRFIEALAIQSEISGMIAENNNRENDNLALAYGEDAFQIKSEELRILNSKHDDQL